MNYVGPELRGARNTARSWGTPEDFTLDLRFDFEPSSRSYPASIGNYVLEFDGFSIHTETPQKLTTIPRPEGGFLVQNPDFTVSNMTGAWSLLADEGMVRGNFVLQPNPADFIEFYVDEFDRLRGVWMYGDMEKVFSYAGKTSYAQYAVVTLDEPLVWMNVTDVPEPSTLLLALLGVVAMLGGRARARR